MGSCWYLSVVWRLAFGATMSESESALVKQLKYWKCTLEMFSYSHGEYYEIKTTQLENPIVLVQFVIFDVPKSTDEASFKPTGNILFINDFFTCFQRAETRSESIKLRNTFRESNQNMANYFMSWIFEFAAVKKVDYVLLFSAWTGFSKKEAQGISDYDLIDRIVDPKRAKALSAEIFTLPQFKLFRTADGNPVNASQALQRIKELRPLVQKNGFYGKYGFIRVKQEKNFRGKKEWPKIGSTYSYTHYADMRARHPLILKAPFVDLARH